MHLLQPAAAVVGNAGLKPLFFKIEMQQLGDVVIVLYDQHTSCHDPRPFPPPQGGVF